MIVCSVGEGLTESRDSVLGQLWQANLRADASLSESANLHTHLEQAHAAGAQHAVIVRHSRVTIKQLGGARGREGKGKRTQAEEEEVPINEVAKYFLNRKGSRGPRARSPSRIESGDARRI